MFLLFFYIQKHFFTTITRTSFQNIPISYIGLSTISLSNPNLVRSIVWKDPSRISSEIASPTAGDC